MFILHDPSSRMTKQSYMKKHSQIDVAKRSVNFHCATISLCEAFTVLIFEYDKRPIQECNKNGTIPIAVKHFGHKIF